MRRRFKMKSDGIIPFLWALMVLLIFFLLVLFLSNMRLENKCENLCGDAITFEVKGAKGSLSDYLFGNEDFACICYHKDKITSRVGE
jgi:hypothetical protein